jgi:hypothetical protein
MAQAPHEQSWTVYWNGDHYMIQNNNLSPPTLNSWPVASLTGKPITNADMQYAMLTVPMHPNEVEMLYGALVMLEHDKNKINKFFPQRSITIIWSI